MELEDLLKKEKEIDVKDIKYPIKRLRVNDDSITLILEDDRITLSDDAYLTYGLKDLKGLDEDLYLKLKDEERLFKAYRGCLRKLSMKDHTVKQIRDYLHQKELEPSEINEMIDKLTDMGLLDDEKYCISRINYLSGSDLSAKEISRKLKQSGISEQLITKYLKTDLSEEYRKAEKLASKYNDSIKNKSKSAKKQAIYNKLINHGFTYEAANEAIQRVGINGENEVELLQKEFEKSYRKFSKKYEDYELDSHIISSLLQKGFSYDDIKKVMEDNHGQTS